ncbi:putative transcriptional regulator [Actinacidiphila reveromycinica]|uniref:Putative transcriptional regulator n=1 Tax=Actinacidiphila reveromycinica TaxID=659352 RepID=A0A7U3UYJ5_9ACTN|nr:transcriptional regulator [Streptomyces sp. SN-593]BBB01123.1 putative transcriptional regulator [Streptomyces sp. SN-593]
MEPNHILDALLDEAGMSFNGLATRINQAGKARGKTLRYDHTAVLRWLRGATPRGIVPDLICDILAERLGRPITLTDIGLGPAANPASAAPLAGFIERSTALWRGDGQQRADVEQTPLITGLPAIGPVWEWENPPDDLDVSRPGGMRVGSGDIEVLRAARLHYEAMYRQAGGVATRGRIVRFLAEQTAPLVRGAYTDATGRDLHRAVGGLVAVAGICSYDSDRQGLAQRYFHQALRLAKASGDRAFGGYVIALLVNQCLFMRDYRQAVAFAEAGIRAAGTAMSPALATDLYAMQAKAFSRMGDLAGAHRCMTAAEEAAGRIRPGEEPAELGYVQPGLVEAQLAEALISLRDFAPAQDYAAEAVRAQAHARGSIHRLATLATADLGRGEAELAAAHTLDALNLARGQESQRLRDRFVRLRGMLADHGSAAGRNAVEQIDASLSVPL